MLLNEFVLLEGLLLLKGVIIGRVAGCDISLFRCCLGGGRSDREDPREGFLNKVGSVDRLRKA